jgi:hypothetical protein
MFRSERTSARPLEATLLDLGVIAPNAATPCKELDSVSRSVGGVSGFLSAEMTPKRGSFAASSNCSRHRPMGFDWRCFGVAAWVAPTLMTSARPQILRSKQQWIKGWKKLHSNDTIRTDQHQRSSVARPVDTRCRHGSAQVLRQTTHGGSGGPVFEVADLRNYKLVRLARGPVSDTFRDLPSPTTRGLNPIRAGNHPINLPDLQT